MDDGGQGTLAAMAVGDVRISEKICTIRTVIAVRPFAKNGRMKKQLNGGQKVILSGWLFMPPQKGRAAMVCMSSAERSKV